MPTYTITLTEPMNDLIKGYLSLHGELTKNLWTVKDDVIKLSSDLSLDEIQAIPYVKTVDDTHHDILTADAFIEFRNMILGQTQQYIHTLETAPYNPWEGLRGTRANVMVYDEVDYEPQFHVIGAPVLQEGGRVDLTPTHILGEGIREHERLEEQLKYI